MGTSQSLSRNQTVNKAENEPENQDEQTLTGTERSVVINDKRVWTLHACSYI